VARPRPRIHRRLKPYVSLIKDEALAYLYFKHGDPLPDGEGGVQSFETVPTSIILHRWIKQFGLPFAGGWSNQPSALLLEFDAVERAYNEYDALTMSETNEILLAILKTLRGANE